MSYRAAGFLTIEYATVTRLVHKFGTAERLDGCKVAVSETSHAVAFIHTKARL